MRKMLWTGEFHQQWYDTFAQEFDIRREGFGITGDIKDRFVDEQKLIQALQGVEVYLVGYDKVTANVLKACPDLKLILSVRDGPEENVDLKACCELGIPVISSAGRCAVSVAEYTFLLMLLLARPVIALERTIRTEGWTKENGPRVRSMYADGDSTELYGKTLGILGFGRNARILAGLASAFNMKVVAFDPYVPQEVMDSFGVRKASKEDTLAQADYLIVLARLTPETEGMLGRADIARMKPTACIVNTGRAKLIDNEAVYDALEQGTIRAAALDVHVQEPLGPDHRAYRISPEKLILTPHAAGATAERPAHQCQLLYTQLHEFLGGKIPAGLCNRAVLESLTYPTRGKTLQEG